MRASACCPSQSRESFEALSAVIAESEAPYSGRMGVLPPEVAHRIAEASGYGVGSLYEYFQNKESLVAASTHATAEVLQEYGGL